jgi:hypothetical protein
MPRARKQPVDSVVDEVKVPEVLITRQQYIEDIKVRWQIHQYEVNQLVKDVRNFTAFVSPYVQQSVKFLQQLRNRFVTV